MSPSVLDSAPAWPRQTCWLPFRSFLSSLPSTASLRVINVNLSLVLLYARPLGRSEDTEE